MRVDAPAGTVVRHPSSEDPEMRTGLTTTRNVTAARAEVAAAVDRQLPEMEAVEERIDTWQLADWTSSLRSWRRTGRCPRSGHAVTVDLLELAPGVTQLTVWTRRPAWFRRQPAPAELQQLATAIRDAAESGSSGSRVVVPAGRPSPGCAAPAAPAVGYSGP